MTFIEMGEPQWNILDSVVYYLETYGWYLLIAGIIISIILNKTITPILEKYRAYSFEREYAAKYHKNPDLFASRQRAQQQLVEQLQEKYNKQSEEYQRKLKEREEKKRLQILEQFDDEKGHRLGTSSEEKNRSVRPDYNPLMGPGPSSNYRPTRKSPCGGGGCGRK